MQRPAKKQASASSRSGESIPLDRLISYLMQAKSALEDAKDDDAALRFELLIDYLRNKPANEPFQFRTHHLGL